MEARLLNSTKLKVLIVDDTRSMRRLIRGLLERLGYRCITAVDGRSGFRKAIRWLPDIIVTDIEMPGWNGFELIRALRESQDDRLENLPIIVCSSRQEHRNMNHSMDIGADAFVSKPLVLSELCLAVDNVQGNVPD